MADTVGLRDPFILPQNETDAETERLVLIFCLQFSFLFSSILSCSLDHMLENINFSEIHLFLD